MMCKPRIPAKVPAALALALLLGACSLTPVLEKPLPPVPASFTSALASSPEAGTGADLGWKTMFGDPRLQSLIDLALKNNRDLRLALLNVQAVRAQFDIQDSARLPTLSANAGVTRQRSPAGDGSPASVSSQKSAGLSVSAFELDLFGRVAALSESAFARYVASDASRRAAQIALVGAVADAYFAQRLAEEQLLLTESTLADWQRSLELAQQLKSARQRSGLDVAEAEGQVATAEADREARLRAVALAGNALDLLTGVHAPAGLPKGVALDKQPVLVQLPAGLPSDLLSRRPDIGQAEQGLVAANADIGAAKAAFFPQISLTASLGYASPSLSGMFDGGQRVWSFAPQITQPLFNHGKLRSELRLAEVRKSAAVVEYEKAVQTAFREVADGLAGRATFGRQIEAQTRVVQSAERRLALSRLRYDAGQDSRLELLDAQRLLYAAQQNLLELRRSEFGNAVALYKALGGGLSSS
ncbi:RND efflux system outer membrane lipoprotein [Janthinobacterium sp. HH01]|uniref:efflux transporter outer membrane subunit n=1 Tax=Janthinobacterium sp. HH01 TaxID=1198452 RepID=UPI0002AE87DA|nr:efflux transporter outer membrane subunit [Janthinobacterium sp. HH01]ELX08992.1 RND efflux system outer membrane lipoprotein [Janthinobacterium sp. HH01]